MGRSKGYIFKIIFTIVFFIATCCSCSIQTLAFNQLNEQTKVKDSDKEAIDSVDVKAPKLERKNKIKVKNKVEKKKIQYEQNIKKQRGATLITRKTDGNIDITMIPLTTVVSTRVRGA